MMPPRVTSKNPCQYFSSSSLLVFVGIKNQRFYHIQSLVEIDCREDLGCCKARSAVFKIQKKCIPKYLNSVRFSGRTSKLVVLLFDS